MEYIALNDLKSYLEIKGDHADSKLDFIVDSVNEEVDEYTEGHDPTGSIKLGALRFGEYLYVKTPGTTSEKDVDTSRSYKDENLEVTDFIPDKYKAEESESGDHVSVDII